MAEKLTLTNRQVLKLHEGLAALDGVQNGASVARFEFDENLSWNIAKNRDIVERAKQVFDTACKTLGATHKIVEGQKITDDNAERVSTFIAARERLLDKTEEFNGLLKIKRTDLQKAGVKVPGILTNLMAILKDE